MSHRFLELVFIVIYQESFQEHSFRTVRLSVLFRLYEQALVARYHQWVHQSHLVWAESGSNILLEYPVLLLDHITLPSTVHWPEKFTSLVFSFYLYSQDYLRINSCFVFLKNWSYQVVMKLLFLKSCENQHSFFFYDKQFNWKLQFSDCLTYINTGSCSQ